MGTAALVAGTRLPAICQRARCGGARERIKGVGSLFWIVCMGWATRWPRSRRPRAATGGFAYHRSPSRPTRTFSRWCGMWSGMRGARSWAAERRRGSGRAVATRRGNPDAVHVSERVAGPAAAELGSPGQSARDSGRARGPAVPRATGLAVGGLGGARGEASGVGISAPSASASERPWAPAIKRLPTPCILASTFT